MDGIDVREKTAVRAVQHESRRHSQWGTAAFDGAQDDADGCLPRTWVNGLDDNAAERPLKVFQAIGQPIGPMDEGQPALDPQETGADLDPSPQRLVRQLVRRGPSGIGRGAANGRAPGTAGW